MIRSTLTIVGLIAFTLCGTAKSETVEANGTDILFMYTFAGVTPNRGKGGNGILIDYLIERDNRKGDADAAALFEELAKTTPTDRFAPTLGCIYRLDDGSCPQIVLIADNPFDTEAGKEELIQELSARGLNQATIVIVTEQAHMGGYHFGTGVHEISIAEGDIDKGISLITWHSEPFNRASDAASRGIDVRNRSKACHL